VDDVLSDAILHKRLLPGGLAYVEVDPMTGQPTFFDHVPERLTTMVSSSLVDHSCGVAGGIKVTTVTSSSGSSSGGSIQDDGGSSSGGAATTQEWVLASAGFDDYDNRN
jgi:uncharacterized membrane protein YgcG